MKINKKIYFSIILIISLFIAKTSYFNVNDKEKEVYSNNFDINKIAYLTFDDGPSNSTEKILDILNKYQVKATFFVVGPQYNKKDKLLKKIISNNHSIGIHSYTHEFSKIYQNKEAFLNDFYLEKNWIETIVNITPKIYRFPGGSSNSIAKKELIKDVIKELNKQGYKHVDWNVDSLDSKYTFDENKIINQTIHNIKTNEKNGIYSQTILLHDNTKKEATIKALPKIIEYCLNNNYTFEVLNENVPLIQHIKSPK